MNIIKEFNSMSNETEELQKRIEELEALLERSYASPLEKKPSQWVEEYRRLMFK